jgi:AI-2 transport protein TqsA
VGDSAVTRNALVVIAVIVAGAAIYWLRGILTPLALAVFLMIMIEGFARALRKRLPEVSEKAAMPLAIVLVLLALGLAVYVVADNITGFVNQTNEYVPRLNERLRAIASRVGLGEDAPTIEQLMGRLNPGQVIGLVAGGVQSFTSDAIFVLIYLGFLLATRRGFARKTRNLFPDPERRREAMTVFEGAREGVEKYLWVQTVTGAMIAAASFALMAVMGEQNALFWAFFIFLTGYVPIVGAAVGVIGPSLFAFVQYESLWQPLVIFGGLQGINFFVGNVIYPRMQGDSLNLDPVVVLLALAFWGLIWGLPGAFLSTPLTVLAMVILAQFKGSRWIAVLISNNGRPVPSETTPQASGPAEDSGRSSA